MKPLGICTNLLMRERKGNQDEIDFRGYLKANNIPFEEVDCYSPDIISRLDEYSGLYWWYSHYVVADRLEAQNILDIAEKKGLKVYPNHDTGWYNDDKIAESYALQAVSAPTPVNTIFYNEMDCKEWIIKKAKYPIVAKLRTGSGSNNVTILRTKKEALKYCKKMFTTGINPSPNIAYKTFSKIQSTRNLKMLSERIKRIPKFMKSRKFAKRLEIERDYCYFQEFIPNDGFDLKIVVVGDKLGFLARRVRKGDFRASGGGEIFYDRELVSDQIIKDAFRVSDELHTQCVGFDFVVDKRNGRGLIIEMCYGFDQNAIFKSNGYFDRNCEWHNEALNVSKEIIDGLYGEYTKRS